jgi:potassium-dependent mechanosensitive channel
MIMRFASAILFALSALQEKPMTLLQRIWYYVNYDYRIGKISVSLTSLVTGLVVLLVALALSRAVQAVLHRRISKSSHIDPGIQYTITRLAYYTIITLGVLFSIKAAFGLDLTTLAVVFTALSVGIGFGLQYIAADIASGFILLFERPIRVGDHVTIGDDEGDVQGISLRTTLVMTNDHIAIIVPNSKLVSQRLVNWTYGDPRVRTSVYVSVAPGSDVDMVTTTLLEAANGVENIIDNPKPAIQLAKFGGSSFDFRLMVWTANPRAHPQIQSDLNFRVQRLFRERGIKLPSTTSQLQLVVDNSQADGAEKLFKQEAASDERDRHGD